jgi:heme A synthase
MSLSLVVAQCVMCYRTAASQQTAQARALDTGIGVLLAAALAVVALVVARAARSGASRSRQLNCVQKPDRV